ncbi:hypothetical protein ACJJIX_18800 [Microbulbifer sp. VAAC004]|uniref:hypothetical protein n=2 Tax=Microbulbifer TaxID=48073 RepID=UPI0040391142
MTESYWKFKPFVGVFLGAAWFTSLVLGLKFWEMTHTATLFPSLPRAMQFALVLSLTGVIIFVLAELIVLRFQINQNKCFQHLERCWTLYLLAILIFTYFVAHLPNSNEHVEAPLIALAAALMLLFLGICIDIVMFNLYRWVALIKN